MNPDELAAIMEKMIKATVISGQGIVKTGIRKWWNPMRYIKGEQYIRLVPLKKVYK